MIHIWLVTLWLKYLSSTQHNQVFQSKPSQNGQNNIDRGWAYVILVVSFMINVINSGSTLTFGVMYPEIKKFFDISNFTTSWIGSIQMSCYLLFGVLAGALIDHYGCRAVLLAGSMFCSAGYFISAWLDSLVAFHLLFAVIGGIGHCFMFIPAVVMVQCYFEKKRSFATCISYCGGGVGMMIFGPLRQYMIDTYGWRGTLIINSGIILNVTVLALLVRPQSQVSESKIEDDNDMSFVTTAKSVPGSMVDISLLKIKVFAVFLIGTCTMAQGFLAPLTFLVDRSLSKGMNEQHGANLILVLGACNLGARFTTGWIGERGPVKRQLLFALANVIYGAASVLYILGGQPWLAFIYAVVVGYLTGLCSALLPMIVVDLVGVSRVSIGFGFSSTLQGMTILGFVPLMGWLSDITNGYEASFIMSGLLQFAGGIMLLYVPGKSYKCCKVNQTNV